VRYSRRLVYPRSMRHIVTTSLPPITPGIDEIVRELLMARDSVFTTQSLQACLEQPGFQWFQQDGIPGGARDVLKVQTPQADFVIHRQDTADSPRIILLAQDGVLEDASPAALRTILERIHHFAREAERPPVKLPLAWNEYHRDNLIAFFACPRSEGSFRWIAELHPESSKDVCFWYITTTDDPIQLSAPSWNYMGVSSA
jgi:hypothetical protein